MVTNQTVKSHEDNSYLEIIGVIIEIPELSWNVSLLLKSKVALLLKVLDGCVRSQNRIEVISLSHVWWYMSFKVICKKI